MANYQRIKLGDIDLTKWYSCHPQGALPHYRVLDKRMWFSTRDRNGNRIKGPGRAPKHSQYQYVSIGVPVEVLYGTGEKQGNLDTDVILLHPNKLYGVADVLKAHAEAQAREMQKQREERETKQKHDRDALQRVVNDVLKPLGLPHTLHNATYSNPYIAIKAEHVRDLDLKVLRPVDLYENVLDLLAELDVTWDEYFDHPEPTYLREES